MGGRHGHGARVAVVTGAGGGIGRAVARALRGAGMSVALVDRDAAALDDAVDEMRTGEGPRARGWCADVVVPSAATEVCASVAAKLGPIESLVCAAGIYGPREPFVECEPDAWWKVVETNLRGAMLYAHAVLPSMIARSRGSIVNINSRAAVWDDPGQSSVAYSTSKAGLARFTGALAAQLEGTGVFVADVGPGMVRTEMTASRPDYDALPDEAFMPLAAVADTVVALVSRRYPELHGRFVHVTDELDQLAAHVGETPRARMLGFVPTGADDRVALPDRLTLERR